MNIDRLLSTTVKSVLVLFYASWCPFCLAFKSNFTEAADSGICVFATADLSDLNNPLWERFNIKVVPTLIFFQNARSVFRKDGTHGRGLQRDDLVFIIKEIETYQSSSASVEKR